MITPIFLLPKSAFADGPICSLPELTIPDSPGAQGDNGAYPGPIVTDTLVITSADTILDLNVYISTTHTYVGDLVFTLTHKIDESTITSTAVISRSKFRESGGSVEPACTGDNIDIILDDEATLNVHDDCNEDTNNPDDPEVLAYIAGESYRPYTHTVGIPGALYIFDGAPRSGVWELAVNDNFEGDGPGVLHQWCLLFGIQSPELQISKDDGVASVAPGDNITYTLTYANNGTLANNVVITETLPANTSLSSNNLPGWQQVGATNLYTYNIGDLGIGLSQTITFVVTVDDPLPAGVANIINLAEIGDDGTAGDDSNPDNNNDSETTPINAAPDLQINKADGGATATEGDAITYTLTYINAGNKEATNVVITETVPNHTTFNPGASTPGWACTPNNNAGSACTRNISSLAGGGVGGSATFVVTVDDPLPAGVTTITNTVQIGDDGANGGDSNPADNQDTEPTEVDTGSSQSHVYLPIVLKN
jgi:uncharacterized repeat protein (TIGR01451 family)